MIARFYILDGLRKVNADFQLSYQDLSKFDIPEI